MSTHTIPPLLFSTPELTVWVPGTPAPQGSMKAFVRGKRAMMTSANRRTMPWRETIRNVLRAHGHGRELLDCPTFVSLAFYFERPKSHYNKKGLKASAPFAPTAKPDLDKLIRAVGDALTGVAVWDDSRIVDTRARKVYTDGIVRTEAGLLLSIEPMDARGSPVRWGNAIRRDARTGSVVQ